MPKYFFDFQEILFQILRIEYPKPLETSIEKSKNWQEAILKTFNPEKHRVHFAILVFLFYFININFF